jgi:two-component system response regulator HydG
MMAALRARVSRVGSSELTVLLMGEPGTGKARVAQAIHLASRRRGRPFVTVNCATLPADLLDLELFGGAGGAAPETRSGKRGLLVAASSGTLLIDELSGLPLDLQAKLSLALDRRAVRLVGTLEEVRFDTRVICTSNVDLTGEVAAKRFRADLFFRVSGVQIDVPPLRERGSDVLVLARKLLEASARAAGRPAPVMTDEFAAKLLAYAWPGNLRELENAMHGALALGSGDRLVPDDLPEAVRAATGTATTPLLTLAELERRHVLGVWRALGGSAQRAARVLGVSRDSLDALLHKHGVLRGRGRG